MELARSFGKTVGELASSLDDGELELWFAYDDILAAWRRGDDPIEEQETSDEEDEDAVAARIQSVMARFRK